MEEVRNQESYAFRWRSQKIEIIHTVDTYGNNLSNLGFCSDKGPIATLKTSATHHIDPMHKWRQFKYSFIYIQISHTSLILGNIFFSKFNSRTRLVGLISM